MQKKRVFLYSTCKLQACINHVNLRLKKQIRSHTIIIMSMFLTDIHKLNDIHLVVDCYIQERVPLYVKPVFSRLFSGFGSPIGQAFIRNGTIKIIIFNISAYYGKQTSCARFSRFWKRYI